MLYSRFSQKSAQLLAVIADHVLADATLHLYLPKQTSNEARMLYMFGKKWMLLATVHVDALLLKKEFENQPSLHSLAQ
jgi:hypothetical protein